MEVIDHFCEEKKLVHGKIVNFLIMYDQIYYLSCIG